MLIGLAYGSVKYVNVLWQPLWVRSWLQAVGPDGGGRVTLVKNLQILFRLNFELNGCLVRYN